VSSRNREKRIRNRESRNTALEEARRRARRRRIEVATGGIVLAIVIAIAFVVRSRNDNKTASPTTTTTPAGSTTSSVPLKSVAGQPCVKVSDPLPKGAPAVPVKVGPPPKTLVKQDLKVGTGAVVKANANVSVNYIGVACSTGKIFDDSSYTNGVPGMFSLNGVIPGWTEGIPGMRVGGERLLGIPPALAYQSAGSAPLIAPDETLWFVIQIVSIQ
jgi:peptidylprolyl isomerase